uniref:Uncharacterized protein n=1 Tax=Nyssomyia neivai TaxID=330878 RepID=A0A1L8D8C2_9DIPT
MFLTHRNNKTSRAPFKANYLRASNLTLSVITLSTCSSIPVRNNCDLCESHQNFLSRGKKGSRGITRISSLTNTIIYNSLPTEEYLLLQDILIVCS